MSAHWVQTYSGIRFDLLEPTVDMVEIGDIAHHLATSNRFNGAADEPYSIAQHSLAVAHAVAEETSIDPTAVLYALLHDAEEAYMGDLVSPLKSVPAIKAAWKPIADNISSVIFEAFGLPRQMPDHIAEIVHATDLAMCVKEKNELFANPQAQRWELEESVRPHPGMLALREVGYKQVAQIYTIQVNACLRSRSRNATQRLMSGDYTK